ncbi:MAG: substrate-binding domain-containing protein [Gemmataceae bacterium]
MFRSFLMVTTALACLVPAGCGARSTTPVKYRIAVIPKGLTHEFWKSIERGARRAAADLGEQGIAVEILWDGPRKESDAQDQIGIVQQMAASRGIHGMVLAPQDSKAMVPVVKETVERKIPVVIIDSGLDDPSLIVKYVATDNYNGGRMAARHLLEVLNKAGKPAPKLVLFRYQPGSESTEQREQGFLDEVKEASAKLKKAGKPVPEIISDNVYSGATVDSAQAAAGPLLVRIKDEADGVFAVNESAATGLLNAMRSQNLNKKIRIVAFDSSEPLLQAVEEGDVEGTVVQDPYRMGYLGVWVLVRSLEGDDVTGGGKNLTTGEYLLTRDNLNTPETRERFDPTLQGRRTIKTPELKSK